MLALSAGQQHATLASAEYRVKCFAWLSCVVIFTCMTVFVVPTLSDDKFMFEIPDHLKGKVILTFSVSEAYSTHADSRATVECKIGLP